MVRWIQVVTVLAVIAITLVIISEYREHKQFKAWNGLGDALAQENRVEALEIAREASGGTNAEPWIAFDLTMALYQEGSAEDLQRAAQVAQATIQEYPDHPVSKLLAGLLPALKSYAPATTAGS